jgi:hypothetical protein
MRTPGDMIGHTFLSKGHGYFKKGTEVFFYYSRRSFPSRSFHPSSHSIQQQPNTLQHITPKPRPKTQPSAMPESTSPTLPTNTIIITNLEVPHFEMETMLKLKEKAESFGEVFYFAPIKSFYRVFVVYKATADAQRAKSELHNTTFEGSTVRVYFGQASCCEGFFCHYSMFFAKP